MKTILNIFAAAALVLGLSACSGSNEPLSASSAKKALKKEAIFAKDSQVYEFATGFQEVSLDYLQKLAKLKAAGMITYTTEKAIETVKKREWGGYYTGYYTTTEQVPHYFANVSLTEEGLKYVVEKPTTMREDDAKDVKFNEDYEELIPDYMSAVDNAMSVAEENQGEATDSVEVVEEEVAVEEEVVEAPQSEPAKPAPDVNAAYNSMMARINVQNVFVRAGRFELVKVKNVFCTEDMFKAGEGTCAALYKFVDKTPFGYVFDAPAADYVHEKKGIKFRLYQDRGWVVVDAD